MKAPLLALAFTLLSPLVQGQCPELLKEAKRKGASQLVILFDGLGTAELGMKLLEKRVFSTIEERCGEQNVISANFYYSKNGAKEAAACAESFEKEFGSHFSLHTIGHSFGAGKGVFNLIEEIERTNIVIENAITFDPRGYSYRYTNPGEPTVENFVNVYQKIPLAGKKVKRADHEFNRTGKTSHISLPKDFADLALEHAEGALNCARR